MQIDTDENWVLNAVAASGREEPVSVGFDLNPVKAVQGIGRSIRRTSRKVGKTLSSVPVVGPGLHSIYKLGMVGPIPIGAIDFAANVASGKRIDKAAYGAFKERIKAYQDIAPYVQTVVSFVPAIGQGLSGAIGAANALSKGQPITKAVIEAARGALPGGPAAAAAFDVAVAGIQGRPIDETLLQAVPLPPEQKQYLVQSVLAAKDIALGKPVDEAIFKRGRDLLPPQAQKALDTGIALAQGQKLQQIACKAAPTIAPILAEKGKNEAETNPLFKVGFLHFTGKPDEQKGYAIGLGTMKFKSNPMAFNALRASLQPNVRKGFDVALSTKIGQLTAPPLPGNASLKEKFGYYAAQGIKGAKTKNKVSILNTLATNPEARKGAIEAAQRARLDKPEGFFAWLKRVILGDKKS
jgi:hypothetical protein